MNKGDLQNRLFDFAVRTINFLRTLSDTYDYRVIKYQLTKSCTSSGANYEEAQAGSSKADFNNKVRISLREMHESNYWLRIVQGLNNIKEEDSELSWLWLTNQKN